ncbi:MAG: hypothetical protein AAGI17_10435 [Planctomycetota bacterium]
MAPEPDDIAIERPRLGIGIAASLLAHATVAALVIASTTSVPAERNTLDPAAADSTPPPPREDRIKLGLAESRRVTVNWLGFEDPTPQQAPTIAEFEQAALSVAARGQNTDPAVRSSPAPSAETQDRPVEEEPQPTPADAAAANPSIAAPAAESEAEKIAEKADPDLVERIEPKETAESAANEEQPEPAPPKPNDSAPEAPAQDTTDGGSDDQTGIPSDRESTPTSIDREIEVEPGKPAAAEGLQISTVRPRFSTTALSLYRQRGRPSVVVEIRFGSDGRVKLAEFARRDDGQPLRTGLPAIDQSLLDAVYRWRAAGERIDALDTDDRLDLRMRINLK